MSDHVTIRASSLGDFTDCPARAEAKHLIGLKMPSTPPSLIGTAVHKSTAVFDQSTIEGAGLTPDDAAAAAVDTIQKPDEDMDWTGDTGPKDAENIAVALHKLYCAEIAPKQDYAAVEVQCERLDITDLGISLTGTTDRIRRVDDGFGIADVKTGKRAVSAQGTVETKGHAYQMGVYELLAENASGLPVTAPARIFGLQTGKTEKGQRAAESAPIVGARETLVGDGESPGVLEIVAQMIHSGTFVGNPRSNLCHSRYCPIYNKCKFRK